MTRRRDDDDARGPQRPRLRPAGVEAAIEQARRDGAFDDLPGRGKPLPDASRAYDPAWWARKLVEREKLSVLPPALEVRRSLERLREALPGMRDEARVRAALEALDAEIARLNRSTTSGPATSVPRIDVEAEIARWREGRDDR
jgi:hypothetical protein